MESHSHGCSGWPCNFGRLRPGALLCGIFICGILVANGSHVLASTFQQETQPKQEQLGSPHPEVHGVPPVEAIPPKTVDSPTSGVLPKSRATKVDAFAAQGGGTLVVAESHTKPDARTGAEDGVSDPSGLGGFAGNNMSEPEGQKTPEASLSVAERVRRRFHSHKHFQDEGERETSGSLDPLPHSVIEEMLEEAQAESVRNSSRTKVTCLSNCSMHGVCTPYGCSCVPGWGGADCSSRSCPKNCSGNGVCVEGTCKCTNGFLGIDCAERENDDSLFSGECPNDCSNNGICDSFTRQCTCNEGFVGRFCGEERCPNDCLPNGQCAENGRCVCQLGYGGVDCSVEMCPNSCSGLGVCSSIGCLCYEGSGGPDCSKPQKTDSATPYGCASDSDCSRRGSCEAGRCSCNTGQGLHAG